MPKFDLYQRIARPRECHVMTDGRGLPQPVDTPERYVEWAHQIIGLNMRARPTLGWRQPFPHPAKPAPFVNAGRWVVKCEDCNNLPIYDPEWQMACCGECGAVYQEVSPPADRERIEAVLLLRPDAGTRHWNTEIRLGLPLARAEAIEDLWAQNREAGDPVPEEAR